MATFNKKSSFTTIVRFFNIIWFILLAPGGTRAIILENLTTVAKLLNAANV